MTISRKRHFRALSALSCKKQTKEKQLCFWTNQIFFAKQQKSNLVGFPLLPSAVSLGEVTSFVNAPNRYIAFDFSYNFDFLWVELKSVQNSKPLMYSRSSGCTIEVPFCQSLSKPGNPTSYWKWAKFARSDDHPWNLVTVFLCYPGDIALVGLLSASGGCPFAFKIGSEDSYTRVWKLSQTKQWPWTRKCP